MANERVIRINAELDTSGMLSSINQVRQLISGMNVDSSLFKDVNKDLEKISKLTVSIAAAMKNGVPEKELNGLLRDLSSVSKLSSTLPDKIKQISIQTSNIQFPVKTLNRLDEIERDVEKLGKEAKQVLGDDLSKALRDAIPKDIITDDALKNINKAENKIDAFTNHVNKLKETANNASSNISNIMSVAVNKSNSSNAGARNTLNNTLTTMLSSGQSIDKNLVNQQLKDTAISSADQLKLLNNIDAYNKALEQTIGLEQQRQQIVTIVTTAETTAAQKNQQAAQLEAEGVKIVNDAYQEEINKQKQLTTVTEQASSKMVSGTDQVSNSVEKSVQHLQHQDSLLKQIASRATSLIGIGAVFNYITRGVRDAWNGIKDLDKEFTQIAVVTDKTTSQLWNSYGTYSQMAQGLGVATKDAVATSALYYQQGLDTADVMTLTAETIKMAQIAGMDFATATNQMTAAIRGFNLEMNQASMVNDIFSTLAANAAVSTQELSYALTKTASIAESAGMSIDTTSAFLTKMIETTREAPENIGTAMKSIVARFEELKKNPLALTVDVEGEEVVANKVEAAIALAGVKLRDASGQFRDLDDVFLELAKSWDGLDRNTQRYIATIAAGSRQQSRFIALMDGYDRTLELTEIAQDSEGQSAAQFLKTLDSLDSKLNRVGNSLEQLYQKFVDSEFFGGLLNGLNDLLQNLGKMDAGQLAVFLTTGVLIGNTIIKGIQQAIRSVETKSFGLEDKIGKSFIGKGIQNIATNSVMHDKGENKKSQYSIIAGQIKEKYNIDTSETLKKLGEVKFKADKIKNEITQKTALNIDTTEAKQKLQEVSNEEKRVMSELKGQIRQAKIEGNIKGGEAVDVYKDLRTSMANADKDLDKQFEDSAKKRADLIKQNATQNFMNAGMALVSSMTMGISLALSSEDPFKAIVASVSAFTLQTLPQIFSQMASATSKGMAGIRGAIDAAGGWITLILEGIGIALSILIPIIVNAASKVKTESKKLQDELDTLQERQKTLQETSEKSTAEAAVEKTKYRNIQKLKEEYFELYEKTGRTTEENEKLSKIIEQIKDDFPDLIQRYNEAGEAVIKEKEQWEEIVKLQKESAKTASNQAFADKLATSNNKIKTIQTQQDLRKATNAENLREDSGRKTNDIIAQSVLGTIATGMHLGSIGFLLKAANEITKFATGTYDKATAIDNKAVSNIEEYQKYLDSRGRTSIGEEETTDIRGNKIILKKYSDLTDKEQEIYNSFFDKEAKETLKQETEALKEQKKIIADHMVSYIKSFSDSEELEGYSDETLEGFTQAKADEIVNSQEYSMDAMIGGAEEVDNFFQQLQNAGALTSAEVSTLKKKDKDKLNEAIKKFKENGTIDWGDIGFNTEEIQVYEEAFNKFIQNEQSKKIEESVKQLEKVSKEMKENDQSEEFDILTNMGAYSNQKVNEVYNRATEEQKEVFSQSKKIYNEKVTELENFGEGQLKPIIDQYGTDLAEYIKSKDLGKAATEAVIDSLNDLSLTGDEIKGLTNLISSVTDWGDTEQLKRLGEEIYKITGNTKITINTVSELRDQFVDPIKLQFDADKAKSDMSEIAKSLNDMRKGFKDLKSAMDEYNENGKISGETVLDLIENGQLMYLEYNKETKAITINKNAMEDYYKAQVAMGKYQLLQKKQDALEAIAELEARRANLKEKREILIQAYANEGKLTSKQYERLQELNSKFGKDTFKIEDAINQGVIDRAADTFVQLEGITTNGFGGILEAIKNNGPKIAEAMANAISGNFSAIDTNLYFDADASKKNIDDFLSSYKRRTEIGDTSTKQYIYEYNEEDLYKYIEAIDKELELTEASLEAKKKYYELLNKGENIYDAVTESGLDKFLSDTAKATKDANKELKDYVSTLERFYNLNKEIEEADRKQSKAKKAFEKDRTFENGQAYLDATVEKGTLGLKKKKSGEEQEKKDRGYARDEFKQLLSQKGIKLSPESFDKLFEKFNMQEGATGQLDQRAFKQWLIEQTKAGKVTYDNAQDIENLFKEWLGLIDADLKMQIDGQDQYEDSLEEIEGFKDELKEIKEALDPLVAIKAGIEAANKILEKAKEDLEDYYTSGGKEGINIAEYGHTVGSAINLNDITLGKLANYKNKLTSENSNLMDYLVDLGNGQWTYNYATIGNITDKKTIDAVSDLLEKLKDVGETEEELIKKNKELGKSFQEALKKNRLEYSNMINRVAQAMAELDQKEIDEVKKKYQRIQDEDDKYLQSLQKSIDKQRQLRDQAKSYDDLEKDEKRLALLERDTSDANASEIAALREQIKDKRQNLVDTEQDNIVNNIAESNEKRKNEMNEETEFLQNVMDERTYDMQYYINKAYEIVDAAINGDEGAYQQMLDILKKTDEEFYRNTKEGQQIWVESFDESWTHVKDHALAEQQGLTQIIGKTQKDTHEALVNFAKEDETYAGEASKALDALAAKTGEVDFTQCWDDLKTSCEQAKNAMSEVIDLINKGPYETEARLKWYEEGKPESLGGSGGSSTAKDFKDMKLSTDTGEYGVSRYDGATNKYYVQGYTDDEEYAKYIASQGTGGHVFLNTSDLKGEIGINKDRDRAYAAQNRYTSSSLGWYRNDNDKYNNRNDTKLETQETTEEKKEDYETLMKSWEFEKDRIILEGPYGDQRSEKLNKDKYYVLDQHDNLLYEGSYESATLWAEDFKKQHGDTEKFNVVSGENLINYSISNLRILGLLQEQSKVWKKRYLNGGIVDYTGLAQVDGTPTNPEAFLNADDTRNMKLLLEALNTMISTPSIPSRRENSDQKAGDTNVEIHIEVAELADGYDTEQMCDDIADQVRKATGNSNVNII